MISSVFLWIPALVLATAAVSFAASWVWWQRSVPALRPLPDTWRLSPRPVFSATERRVYRLLRDALPHHAILAKLPLVRFSQPDDPNEVRHWYALLGTAHVAFAICSASGRVLAAIDLDNDASSARRTLQIKQAVLGACRVRYLRCPIDNLPTIAEIQALVPPSTPPRAAAARPDVAIGAAGLTRPRPPAPADGPWHDSTPYNDSFFTLETRADGSTDFAGLGSTRDHLQLDLSQDDVAGVVDDMDPPRRA